MLTCTFWIYNLCSVQFLSPHPFTPPPMAVDQTSGPSCKERIFCFSTIVWDASFSGRDANTSGQAACVCECATVCFCGFVHVSAHACMTRCRKLLRFNTISFCHSWDGCLLRRCWPSSELRLWVNFLQEVVQKSSCECGGLNFLERLTFNFNLKSNFVCFY